jgi:hypothetical protein
VASRASVGGVPQQQLREARIAIARLLQSAQCAHLDAEWDIRAATEEQVPGLAVAGDGDLAAEFPGASDAADESPTRRDK